MIINIYTPFKLIIINKIQYDKFFYYAISQTVYPIIWQKYLPSLLLLEALHWLSSLFKLIYMTHLSLYFFLICFARFPTSGHEKFSCRFAMEKWKMIDSNVTM